MQHDIPRLVIAGVVALAMSVATPLPSASAAEVTVPIDLQLQLLGKVARFERGFGSKGGAPATVVIVTKPGVTASSRAGAQLSAGFAKQSSLAGRPLTVKSVDFQSAAALRQAAQDAAIVYVTPGLDNEIGSIAASFSGSATLTVAAAGADVEKGIALGFALEGSRPRILVNLVQARAQRLDFNSQLLRLAKVVP